MQIYTDTRGYHVLPTSTDKQPSVHAMYNYIYNAENCVAIE